MREQAIIYVKAHLKSIFRVLRPNIGVKSSIWLNYDFFYQVNLHRWKIPEL